MKKECCDTNNNRTVVFQESKSKLIIENIDGVEATKVVIDGCEIKTGIRCDYLYLIKNLEIYIELKGQDIHHAVKQVESTIKKVSKNPKACNKKAFIICTRSPLSSASIQNIRVKFKKKYNSDLIVKSSPHRHKE